MPGVTSVTAQREAALASLLKLKLAIKSSESDVWSGLSDREDFRWSKPDIMSGISISELRTTEDTVSQPAYNQQDCPSELSV